MGCKGKLMSPKGFLDTWCAPPVGMRSCSHHTEETASGYFLIYWFYSRLNIFWRHPEEGFYVLRLILRLILWIWGIFGELNERSWPFSTGKSHFMDHLLINSPGRWEAIRKLCISPNSCLSRWAVCFLLCVKVFFLYRDESNKQQKQTERLLKTFFMVFFSRKIKSNLFEGET